MAKMRQHLPRVALWTIVLLLSLSSLLVSSSIRDDFTDNEVFRIDWILVDQLDSEIPKLAEFAGIQRKPGYREAFLYEVFVPKETRLQLGLQNVKGLRRDTKPGEFAFLVFGRWYAEGILEYARVHDLPNDRAKAMLAEAQSAAKVANHSSGESSLRSFGVGDR